MKIRGFSLFEVIVYIAIISVVMTAVLSIVARSVLSRVKAEALYTVTSTTRFAMERMVQDVRAAVDINEDDLDNDILTVEAVDGTIRSYAVVANQLTVSTNGATAITLTPSSVNVTEFSVTDRTDHPILGIDSIAVQISLALATASTNPRPEYQADFSLVTTAIMRL